MQASKTDRRLTSWLDVLPRTLPKAKSLPGALTAGPDWRSSRALTSGAAAAVAVLAITGVVALSTSGSAATQSKDVAATSKPAAKPHYLLPIGSLVREGAVPAPTLSGDTGTVGVPKGTVAPPTTPTANPAASTITTYRGGAGTMTPAGIATLALERGCPASEAPTATAIAMAESGGSPSAQGDITLMTDVWDWSAGLWQIRGLRAQRGTGALRDSVANQQAVTNSAAMYAISSGCTNWSPWTTYTRGLYTGYLGVAQQAVDYVLAYYRAHGHYPPVAAPDPDATIPAPVGGIAAAPAALPGTTARTPKPTKARTSGAAKTPGGGTTPTSKDGDPGSGGGNAGGGGGAPSSTTPQHSAPAPTPTPTPAKPTVPTLPLPTITPPVISLPVVPPITLPPLALP